LDAAIDPTKLRRDVLEMRQRVAEQFPEQNCWRLKYVRGGLMDAEFLCQYLQLRFGGQHREIFAIGTVDAFERIEGAGVLPVGMAARLAGHVILFHNVEALLRLCLDGEIDEASFPAGLTAGLGRLGGGPDLAAVRRRLIAAQADVLTMFRTLVEQPATAD
jgi:glutamate-ammonia-ligase adenylyltransferase